MLTLGQCHFLPGGDSRKLGDQIFFLRSKGGSKDFFQIKKGGSLIFFFKEAKYFVKHFRFQRKDMLDATRGRKLQWDLSS